MSGDIISSRAMVWAAKVQSIADQARDLTLDAAQSVGARYADESKAVDVQKLLEGRSDREKIDGMRRVIAISSKGVDMSDHFASVVKNVASSNLELRKLVYIYLARYAESQPDLALLSINTIQKALSDQNQIVRALALRLLSSIRVTSISGIVLLSIKKCVTDSSEYVRKTAAMSIAKTNALDRGLHTQLLECLKIVLADESPQVMAAAIETYDAICPSQMDLLHPIYRRACQTLERMDEFAQVNVLAILERYARNCFTNPQQIKAEDQEKDFYEADHVTSIDHDLTLLLKATSGRLMSRNSATVIAACRVLSRSGTQSDSVKIVAPLISLLRASADIQFVALSNIVVYALQNPNLWSSSVKHFLIHPSDAEYIWQLKLEMLTLIIDADNANLIVSELAQYSYLVFDEHFAKSAIRALCKAAQHAPDVSRTCIDVLFEHIHSDAAALIGEAVIALRQLIQLNPSGHISTIKTLAKSLESITAPAARASIFWLVSENIQMLPRIAPDVLRVGVRDFSQESEEVRIQILTLAVKMYVLHSQHESQEDVEEINTAIQAVDEAQAAEEREELVAENDTNGEVKHDVTREPQTGDTATLLDVDSPIPKMYAHICQLARYDTSYDIRDRLRTYKILVSSPSWVLTQKILFCPKPLPILQTKSAEHAKYSTGSSSMLVDTPVTGYVDLPAWSDHVEGAQERNVEVKPPVVKNINNKTQVPNRSTSSLQTTRDQYQQQPQSQQAGVTKQKSKLTGISSLDDFYATTSEEEEDEDEEESSDGTEDDDEEESDEESSDDDDDDDDSASEETSEGSEEEGKSRLLGTAAYQQR